MSSTLRMNRVGNRRPAKNIKQWQHSYHRSLRNEGRSFAVQLAYSFSYPIFPELGISLIWRKPAGNIEDWVRTQWQRGLAILVLLSDSNSSSGFKRPGGGPKSSLELDFASVVCNRNALLKAFQGCGVGSTSGDCCRSAAKRGFCNCARRNIARELHGTSPMAQEPKRLPTNSCAKVANDELS